MNSEITIIKQRTENWYAARIERDQQAIDQLESVIPLAIMMRNEFLEKYRNGISPLPLSKL
jgi:hypothetical protein